MDWKQVDESELEMKMDIDSVKEGLDFFRSLIMDHVPVNKRDSVFIFEMNALNQNDVKRVFDQMIYV